MNSYSFKGILAAASLLIPAAAMAEGYQVNTLSSRQLGMGHTGMAMKLGAESQFFNPAGMAFMTDRVQASASFNGVFATATADVAGKKYKTDNDASTPFSIFGAFNISKAFNAGIAVYTPYGSSINWTDNWPGATLNQSVKLAAYTVQPTVSWRITPKLSVGAGLTLTWGSVDLNKGLLNGPTLNAMLGAAGLSYPTPDITPASINLNGKAGIAAGVNLGVMYDIDDHFTAGVNFRSKSTMKVKSGKTSISYAVGDPTIQGILANAFGGISKTEFKAEMPLPASLGFGASWHNDKVIVDLETQLTFWSTYKSLDIDFEGEAASRFNQHLEKNYKDSWLVRAGAQWSVLPQLDLRAGMMVDFSPCDKNFYNPETPGMTKIEPTLGLTYRPTDHLGINAGVMYVAGLGEDNASYTTPSVVPGMPAQTFTADYHVHSWIASVGLSLTF